MTRKRINGPVVIGAMVTLGAGLGAAQRGWTMPGKSSGRSTARSSAIAARPQASIGGASNGVYCTPNTGNGVGMHHIGGIPAGLNVTATVESYSDGFNPAAAVVVALVGENAGNNVKVSTFYDNDSDGDGDSKIAFVAPQTGDYILLVGDYTDVSTGCYRYEVAIR